MRITVIGRINPDSLAENYVVTLRNMGHTVQSVDEMRASRLGTVLHRRNQLKPLRLYQLLERHPRFQWERDRGIVRQILAFRPDVMINTYSELTPEAVGEIRAGLRNCRCVFWYPDAAANLGREYALAGYYDAWFFKDKTSAERFRSYLGINAHYLPEACNPIWHRPVDLTDADQQRYGCDLCTASNMYYYRAKLLEQFADYDFKIWGLSYPSWLKSPLRGNYQNVYVAREEKAKAFGAAKIVINTLSHKEINSANKRLFESTGCGGFVISDWRPAMTELFDEDREVVFFRSKDELKEKVDYYMRKPEERQRIAQAGCRRAHADHRLDQRVQVVLSVAAETA